jgi:four helix bundle protein
MTNHQTSKKYDLETRTKSYARNVIAFSNSLNKTIVNQELIKQLIRSAGSIGANYIEANEALSKKDFVMRIRICRKEAKEATFWASLIGSQNEVLAKRCQPLADEADQLMKIFAAILLKTKDSIG